MHLLKNKSEKNKINSLRGQVPLDVLMKPIEKLNLIQSNILFLHLHLFCEKASKRLSKVKILHRKLQVTVKCVTKFHSIKKESRSLVRWSSVGRKERRKRERGERRRDSEG